MNLTERNTKVALSHWARVLNKERAKIKNNKKGLTYKAILCGFLAGDGSVEIRKDRKYLHYEIRFYPEDRIMLHEYCKAMKYVYDKIPKIKRKNKFFYVRLTSRTVVEDIVKYSNFGLYKWTLPLELFNVKGAKEAWLRAFFSAEGYVNNWSIKIQTVNTNGIKEVSKLLNEIGIRHKYYEYNPKKNNHSTVGIVVIMQKESRKTFYEKVGFWHSKKTNKLKKSLNL